jgi:hypothetical protein
MSIPLELQAIYPSWLVSETAKEMAQSMYKESNDPWAAAIWDFVERPYEWLWTKVVLYFVA